MFTNRDIARHFEYCESHYRYFWNLAKSRSMHYGYWDDSTHNLHDALMNINKVMSAKAGIGPNDKVLDAGCGLGGSSVWLAKNIGCSVTGITLSEKQRKQGEDLAAKQGLAHKVQFLQEDFTNTQFADASFDVVWGIESICYAERKLDFLKEASRLLKPGGRVIVADFFKQPGLEGKDKELIHKMAYGWAIADFATIADFKTAAAEAGFTKISAENISTAVTPSARKIYFSSFAGMVGTKLYGLFRNASELSKHHARTGYLQYIGLKKGLWQYELFVAEK